MAPKPWVILLIIIGGMIGGIIGLYFIYSKVDSGLKRPTDVSKGDKNNNWAYWDWEKTNKSRFTQKGGKRKRKLRKKQRR